jgi:hypothetical protein
MNAVRLPVLACAALMSAWLSSACTDFARRQDAERARYESYAGPPVEQITWLGRYDGWTSLGKDELVLWTTPFDAYLIKVVPPCTDLPWAERIGITSTASTVSSRFDFVEVHRAGERGPGSRWRCPIAEIRPVDYRRMRHDLREQVKPAHGGEPAQVRASDRRTPDPAGT